MTSMKDRWKEVAQVTRRLKEELPKETLSFLNFMKEAEGGDALPRKQRELINIALAIATQCEWCIAFHVRNAVRADATREEIIAAGFQAIVMGGGPAFMWMTPLLAAVDEFGPTESAGA